MKLTISQNVEDIKDTGNGSYINQSGIYDVTINYVQLAESKNNAVQLNFNVTHQGREQTIYGPYLLNKDGSFNEITKGLVNRLGIIAGMAGDQVLESGKETHPVGKDRTPTEIEVIPEFSGLPVKMRIQMEYRLYNNEIQEGKNIKAFYREDGATAAEATSGENIGERLAADVEKYSDNITYRDGLTEEDVTAWKEARMNAAKAKAKEPAPKVATTAARPLFAK